MWSLDVTGMFDNLIDTKADRCVMDVQSTQGESHLQVLRV